MSSTECRASSALLLSGVELAAVAAHFFEELGWGEAHTVGAFEVFKLIYDIFYAYFIGIAQETTLERGKPNAEDECHVEVVGTANDLFFEVSSGMNKPYYIKSLGMEKGVFVRLGRSTMRANADMIEELKWNSRGLHFDSSSLYHATEDDLDMEAIESFFSVHQGKKKSILMLF